MKIFLVGPGPIQFGNLTKYVGNALKKMGYNYELFLSNMIEKEVIEDKILRRIPAIPFSIDEIIKRHLHLRKKQKLKVLLNQEFIRKVFEFSPDLLLVIDSFSNLITIDSLAEIKKKKKISVVGWVVDDPFRFFDSTKCIFSYDYIFIGEPEFYSQIRFLTNRPIKFLSGAADPDFFKPLELSESERKIYACDINFVGTADYLTGGMGIFRAKLLDYLTEYNIKIWGNFSWNKILEGFPALKSSFQGGILPCWEANKSYNAAKIVMNIHHPFLKSGTNTRCYEIAAASGFQLADKKRGMEQLFELGKEIICFAEADELKELVKYYLKYPKERKEIAERARKRVLKEHTYVHRLRTILENIK